MILEDTAPNWAIIGSSSEFGQELMNAGREAGARVSGVANDAALDHASGAINGQLAAAAPSVIFNLISGPTGSNHAMARSVATATRIAHVADAVGAMIVHLSDSRVFQAGRRAYLPLDQPNATCSYGRAAADAEAAIRETGQCAIIRTGYCLSALIPDLVAHLQTQTAVDVPVAHSIQTCCCQGLIDFTVDVALKRQQGVFHAANGGDCGWYQFVTALRDELEIDCDVVPSLDPDDITASAFPNLPQLNVSGLHDCGMSPPHWRDALRQSVRRLRSQTRMTKTNPRARRATGLTPLQKAQPHK